MNESCSLQIRQPVSNQTKLCKKYMTIPSFLHSQTSANAPCHANTIYQNISKCAMPCQHDIPPVVYKDFSKPVSEVVALGKM